MIQAMSDTNNTKTRRKPSAEHLAAMDEGRKQGRAVKAYLEALESSKRGRGRPKTIDSVQEQLDRVEQRLADASITERLHLLQQKFDLTEQLTHMNGNPDISTLEKEFVSVAAAYSERKGISWMTWRTLGVPAKVLKEAGVTRTRSSVAA